MRRKEVQNIRPALTMFERSRENRWDTLKVVSRQPSSQISPRVDTTLSCFLPKFPLSFYHIYTIFCHIFATISVSFHIATGCVNGSEDFLLFCFCLVVKILCQITPHWQEDNEGLSGVNWHLYIVAISCTGTNTGDAPLGLVLIYIYIYILYQAVFFCSTTQ